MAGQKKDVEAGLEYGSLQSETEIEMMTVSDDAETRTTGKRSERQEEVVSLDPEPLAEDLYGAGIASIIRDSRKIFTGQGRFWLRLSRLSISTMVLVMTIVMQVFLVWEFKKLITAGAVHRVREVYNEYELFMYENHTVVTVNGFHRGIAEYFNPARFGELSTEHKEVICKIPLSQPWFFGCILSIWSFAVVIDMRKIFFLMDLLLVRTDTIDSVVNMLDSQGDGTALLLGLTRPIKITLLLLMFLPRLCLDAVLLWLGCRWLTATPTFADVLLNAMALEFILLLKDLLYEAVVPARDKFETKTMLVPLKHKQKASYISYLGAFSWLLAVIVWVVCYMTVLQRVLPEYKWDIHIPCEDYIAESTRV